MLISFTTMRLRLDVSTTLNMTVRYKKTPVCLVISKQGNVIKMEQVMRIELTTTAWEAVVLPLNYTCNFFAYYIKKRRLSQEKPRRFLYF